MSPDTRYGRRVNGAPHPPIAPQEPPPQAVAHPVIHSDLGETLSPSQVSTYLGCAARWWYKYGAGLPDPAGASFVRGRAVHKMIEIWLRAKKAGAAIEIGDLAEPYDQVWDELLAEAWFAIDDDLDEVKRQGAKLLRLYLEEKGGELQPAEMEWPVSGVIAGVRVRGILDLVDAAGTIVDIKTASKTPSGIEPNYRFQLATYHALAPATTGKARIDTLVAIKTPKIVSMEYQVTPEDLTMVDRIYPAVQAAIQQGGPFAPNRCNNLCSRKWCNFAGACERDWGGTV